MSPEHTDKILAAAKEEFGVVTAELSDRIREAAAGVLEETQDEGKGKPLVRVSVALVINMADSPPTFRMDAAVGVRFKVKGEAQFIDKEAELDFGGGDEQ